MAENQKDVVAPVAASQVKTQYATCILKSVDEETQVNTNGKEYKKVTLTTSTGKSARGVMYGKVWGSVTIGAEVRVALEQVGDDIIPSVVGTPLVQLTMADFGIAPDMEDGI